MSDEDWLDPGLTKGCSKFSNVTLELETVFSLANADSFCLSLPSIDENTWFWLHIFSTDVW